MKARYMTTMIVTIAAATTLGCNGNGPTKSQVDNGIDRAFQAPGQIAGAAGAAGGDLAATAVKTPGNVVEGSADAIRGDD